jgi:hypothetical protein
LRGEGDDRRIPNTHEERPTFSPDFLEQQTRMKNPDENENDWIQRSNTLLRQILRRLADGRISMTY